MTNLTDLEICKRIAEIDGVSKDYEHVTVHGGQLAFGDGANWHEYNPLTDDALCFRLGAKYDTFPFLNKDTGMFESIYSMNDLTFNGGGLVSDESPNRAICLAIIAANDD